MLTLTLSCSIPLTSALPLQFFLFKKITVQNISCPIKEFDYQKTFKFDSAVT